MQIQTECAGACECTFDFYAEGPECIAVADWRAAVNNFGIEASIKEVKALIDATPACLAAHGNPDDWGRFGLLALAARADAPITDLMPLDLAVA
jgi:hypothetical protein